jgi:hypothetical protein
MFNIKETSSQHSTQTMSMPVPLPTSSASSNLNTSGREAAKSTSGSDTAAYTYGELMSMYEKEKHLRMEMENSFQQKAKESNKQVENLNREMTQLSATIDELRKQFISSKLHNQQQLDLLIQVNEELRVEVQQLEARAEQYKNENLRLKAENKQFYGEQSIMSKDFEDKYKQTSTVEEANRQMAAMKADLIKLAWSQQSLTRQNSLAMENIKHLQKINAQYQSANTTQDQVVIVQSLESELERERKVALFANALYPDF